MYPLLPFSLNQPLAVDNAISTIGVIHKIIAKMNEVIDELNNIDSKANEYTDSQIELLNNQLRAYINELNDITINHFNSVDNSILSMNYSIEQLENDISTLHTSFNNLAVSVTEQINNSINAIKSYVDLQIEIVKQLIDAQNPEVIDCFGNKNKLQVAYNNMFSAFKYANGDGTFEKVLNKMKTFSYSTLNMATITYYTFSSAMANISQHKNFSFYLAYSVNTWTLLTQELIHFKDLITNHTACVIMIEKCAAYSGLSITGDFQNALRNSFFAASQYQSATMNPALDFNLR